MKTVIKALLISISIIAISACGLIPQKVDDQDLQKNAAMTIGVNTNNVSINNRETNGAKTTFQATANGKQYICYVTSGAAGLYGGSFLSDAICQPMQSNSSQQDNTPSCNALLKAAGKCK